MKQYVFFLFGLLIVSNTSISQTNSPENRFNIIKTKKTLTAEINKVLKETGIPSISFSLFKGDSIVWSGTFGYANVKKQVPATNLTIYNTGSNFKFITATAIMQLAENGKLDIDDPINNYLEEFKINDFSNDGTPVTFRHLLSHHSGLKGTFETIPLWERKLPKTLEELTSEIISKEPPGKKFNYCNHCYGLAGLLIEKISGVSFQKYIVAHILKPLQIETKGPLVPTPKMVEELALPYRLENNKSLPEYQSRFDIFPAGDLYLTPNEMANFYIAQLNQGLFKGLSILNATSIAEMQKAQFGSSYGLGIGVLHSKTENFLQHAGEVPGFSTFFVAEKKSKRGVYIAANAGNVHQILGQISNLALKLLNGDLGIKPLPSFAKSEFTEIKLTEQALKKYTGNYQITQELFIHITQIGDQLYGQATGQGKFKLFAFEKNKFSLKKVVAQVEFIIKKDRVIGLFFFQNGKTTAKKIK